MKKSRTVEGRVTVELNTHLAPRGRISMNSVTGVVKAKRNQKSTWFSRKPADTERIQFLPGKAWKLCSHVEGCREAETRLRGDWREWGVRGAVWGGMGGRNSPVGCPIKFSKQKRVFFFFF